MSTQPYKSLGKYELHERLGYGGMAEVWKALDTQLQRYVAIKLLHANLQNDPNFVTRFQREAQVIASLRHPNIVQVHDFQVSRLSERDAPTAYMVMTYIEGQTLADYIANTSARGKIPSPTEIVNLFTSISLAVDYAHQKGMVHRDIKPANILLDKHNTAHNPMGEPILTDFGLARLLGISTGITTAAQPGTPVYTSPEQAQGYAGNERSDLYSLGVILYEIVTGVPPFRGDTPVAILSQHLYSAPPSPVLLNPNIPPALTLVIMTALAKDPNSRFARATTMTAALAEALHVPLPKSLDIAAYPPDVPDMATHMSLPHPSGAGLASPSSTPVFAPLTPSIPLSSSGEMHPVSPSVPVTVSGNPVTPLIDSSSQRTSAAATPIPLPTPVSPAPTKPSSSPRGKRWKSIYLVLAALVLLALIGSSLAAYFTIFHQNNAPAVVSGGQALFLSSGQFDFGTAQGVGDELQIQLQHIPDPQSGKAYYAWLLGDRHPDVEANPLQPPPKFTLPLLLGTLSVTRGNASLFYKGTVQHDNLFSLSSRLLITEEDAHSTPRGVAANPNTWRYYAEIPQTPYGATHLSALDHIRHLFYKETRVEVLGLAGGLDIWLFRNTEKVMEWASSARDDYNPHLTDAAQMHDLFLSILDYLDGAPNVAMDVPEGSPLVADPTISKVALLSVSPAQQQRTEVASNPPGYVDHVQLHLNGVVQAPDATQQMRVLATKIIEALNNAKIWLQHVRNYARQLVTMNADQLSSPSTLTILDNMLSAATFAYIGQLNPVSNQVVPGVLQAHYNIQKLATFTLTPQLPQRI